MTSLAKQLERLAVPHIRAVYSEDKRRKSLLFDPKEAAALDKEAIYALGTNGIAELQALDPVFDEFQESLFGESTMSFQRSIQTTEINAQIDETIESFLQRLSPYCLLKPAHKALEWLIYRFDIDVYNMDAFMICLLPFHESKIFVRAVQLLRLKSRTATKWDWLLPIQASGVHLPRQTLINHCNSNNGFFSFLCDRIYKTIKDTVRRDEGDKLRVIFSLYMSTVVGMLEFGGASENLVAALLPHLSRGMKSKVTQYRAATYMILAQLVCKTSLRQDLLKTLLSALFKKSLFKLEQETMTCAALMFQHQEITSLPARSFKHICRQPGLIEILKTLTSAGNCDGLTMAFLDRLVVMAVKQDSDMSMSESSDSENISSTPRYLDILHDFLSSVPLSESVSDNLTKKIIENYLLCANVIVNDGELEELSMKHRKTVQLLEDRYPTSLDRAVQEFVDGEEEDVKRQIQDFLNLSVLSVKHQHLSDIEGSLTLSLNHRTPAIRVNAVQHLLKNADKCDGDYVSEVLITRLADDSPEVMETVLKVGQSLWSMINDTTQMCTLLGKIVLKCQPWSGVGKMALGILCSCDPKFQPSVILILFPRFLLCTPDDLKFLKDLCETDLAKNNQIIKSVAQKLKKEAGKKKHSTENLAEMSIAVAGWLADAVMKTSDCDEFLTRLQDGGDDTRYLCQLALFLNAAIPLMSEKRDQIKWFGNQLKLLHQLQPGGVPETDWEEVITVVTDTCKSLVAGQKQGNSLSLCLLSNLIQLIPTLQNKADFWNYDDDALACSVRLFDYLILQSSTSVCRNGYRRLVAQFLQHFSDNDVRMKFLGLLWTQHCNDLSERSGVKVSLQIQALLIGKQLLHESKKVQVPDSVIINLILAMTSPFIRIRQTTMECLKLLRDKDGLGQSVFVPLVNHIQKCEMEIVSDQEYLKQTVTSVLSSGPNKGKRRSHSGRKTDSSLVSVIVDVVQNSDTPQYIRNNLLQITALHNSKSFLSDLLPTFRSLLSACLCDNPPPLAVDSCRLVIQRWTLETASLLDSNPEALTLVLEMIAGPVNTIQEMMISQVTGEFYSELTPETQQRILSSLFDAWVKVRSPETVKVIKRTLKHLALESSHIAVELNKCLQTTLSASTVKERKRHRKSDVHGQKEEDVFEQLTWQRVVVVLETIQSKKKINGYLQLLPTIFKILSEVLNSDQHTSAEYIKQLLLSVVDEACQRAINHGLVPDLKKDSSFNIDLIVNAIRTSSNPQTHHKALLVLTTASKIFPEDLLHKVMSVFTFMGANIMRHDDQYSFHVINRILETVVPALVTACEQREVHVGGQTKEGVITMVMQVFVDAYTHIPEHRRLMLFTRLVEIVDGNNFLWRCVLLKMTHEISQSAGETTDGDDTEMQFNLNLLSQFSMTTQINSIATMISYISGLPVGKPTETVRRKRSGKHSQENISIFPVETHSAKQLRHFKYRTVKLLLSWCVSSTLVQQLSACEEDEITSGFHHLVQTIMTYICRLTELKLEDHTLAKFYRALSHKIYDLLDKVVGLLPERMLLQVIKELMEHSIPNIQRKSMELLNNFLLQKEQTMEAGLLGVVDKLLHVSASENIEATTTQTALYSLKLLCRRIGANHPQIFIKVLKMSVEIFRSRAGNQSLQASALLCIAEVCSTLKAHVIAHLSSFMPKIVSCLKDNQLVEGNELFLLSMITTVQKVMENLSLFLSPYLQDIVTQICCLSGRQTDVLQKATIQQRLKAIRGTMATTLPPRVLLGILPDCYDKLLTLNPNGIQPMMTMLTEHVGHIKKEDLSSHLVQLQGFYLTCLDVQSHYKGDVEEVENAVIEAIVATVMKLSEATFRPMFYKMFDWATREEDLKHRILVFYKMADRLAEKMQSLFTIFAGHIIVHAAQILTDNNKQMTDDDFYGSSKSGRRKSHKLLVYIFDCLCKCFLYDTEGFVTKERFDTLLQPLVDQLENVDGEPLSKERVSEHLVPCIVQFGAATQDDSLWKTLNYQILLKTRHSSPEVRYAALIAVDEFHKKLSEDYMALLPETIPFLAELMEDEEEEVEKMCQSVISQMERTLGEPLQKYF